MHAFIHIWYVRVDPAQCFILLFVVSPLLCNLCYATFAVLSLHCNFCSGPFKNHFVASAWFTCTCYRISKLGFHVFALLFIALRLLRLPRGYLTTSPIHLKRVVLMLFHCFSLLLHTSGLPIDFFFFLQQNTCVLISFYFSAGATSGLPDNQPYALEQIGIYVFSLLFLLLFHCFCIHWG